jgi:hypothetical protein
VRKGFRCLWASHVKLYELGLGGILLWVGVADGEAKDIFDGVNEGERGVFLILKVFDFQGFTFEVDNPTDLVVFLYMKRSLPSSTSPRISSTHSHLTSWYFSTSRGTCRWCPECRPNRSTTCKNTRPHPGWISSSVISPLFV